MSELTPNLGLFKYNTTTDGKETFSINTALNANWDILDNVISSTSSLGQNGYMKFNNGLIINYGQASVSTQVMTWTQPTMSSNGTVGQSAFALFAPSNNNVVAATDLYKAMDGDTTSTYMEINPSTTVNGCFGWYSTTPLRVTSIDIKNSNYNSYNIKNGQIMVSNDTTNGENGSWTSIASYTPTKTQALETWTIDLSSNTGYYKAYKFWIITGYNRQRIADLTIHATYIASAANSITFPMAYTSTNYAYSVDYFGGAMKDSYVSVKNKTGITLNNISNANTVYYTAVGY